ncbi:unnamed protein product [Aphis gossypii]|uniref:DRBM domain-containing protein n=1 Tax=Aphis gossypii TaxID=80765 RepID=A0A9P0IKQ3_APHGO|nr:unnamed protein product [Aphis gossypii]
METTVQMMYYLANQLFHAAAHVGNSYWNRYKTSKEVENFHQLSSTTQQPSSSPLSPPSLPSSSPLPTPLTPSPPPSPPSPSLTPLPPSPPTLPPSPPSPPSSSPSPTPPPLSPPLQQKHQLTELPVENCVTILTRDTAVIAEKTTRRQVTSKSPLMIFNELVKNKKIQIQGHQCGANNHITSYTAMFEIGGKTYTGNHISKQQAKQKACEKYLMTISKDKLIKKNKGSPEIEVGENISKLKTKIPHQKDFLWSQFASFAMHNFINQQELNPSIKMVNCIPKESTVIKPQPKTGDTAVIAEKTTRRQVTPKSPLMIFNELVKSTNIQIQGHQSGANNHITSYTAMFEIGGKTYIGNHISKQQAKQKACEKYLITIFKDIIKKKGSPEIEVGENTSNSKTKSPHQEDFPGLPFASFAIRHLINQWEVESVVTRA